MNDKPTFDTNILIYAFGHQDDERKQIAKDIITKCNIISLQAVNETAYVLQKKYRFPLNEVEKIISFLKQKFVITNLNIQTLDQTVKIVNQYGFSFWDSMMIAAALDNHCSILYTEDMNNHQLIDNRLRIINPFI